MKKVLLAGLVMGVFTIGLASQASALLTSDVGDIDPLIAGEQFASNGAATEAAWVNDILGTSFTGTDIENGKIEIDTDDPYTGQQFILVENGWDVDANQYDTYGVAGSSDSDEYAWALSFEPGYVYVKTGDGASDPFTHWLFKNDASNDWLTVVMGYTYENVITGGTFDTTFSYEDVQFNLQDIHSISHVVAPVPEPATMILFGTGLAGLAGARARRKKK